MGLSVTCPYFMCNPAALTRYLSVLFLNILTLGARWLSGLETVGPFCLVAMPGEVKDPTSLRWKYVTCRGSGQITDKK